MDAPWIILGTILTGIALLVWLLMRDVRKEEERPRRWWQKKKRKKLHPVKTTPSECPFGGTSLGIPPTSDHPGVRGDCGGF